MVARPLFPADVGACLGDVCICDVDEHFRGGEFGAVDARDGEGEVVFLGGGEGDGVLDFVEGHCLLV